MSDVTSYLDSLKTYNLSLATPEVDWSKSIGVPEMGCKMGAISRNKLDISVGNCDSMCILHNYIMHLWRT